MKIWIRRTLVGALSLLVLLSAVVAGLLWNGERLRARVVQLGALQSPAFAEDAAARERGAYLFASRGCAECHGADGAGRVFVDDGKGLKIKAPAIHSGPGSATLGYTPQDWDRIVRHGVKRNGHPAIVMPSEDYNRLTDADFAALVAHARSLPGAGGSAAVIELPLPVRVLYGVGYVKDAAAKIDHSLPAQQPVPEGVSLEHGRYVANTCLGCHGPELAGGKVPGGPPDWPPAARLNKGADSAMARYPNAESLIAMFRSGKRADGSAVQVMPFESFSKMSDTDLRALYLYLKSL
ncbi:MAG TPA: c-type cytochrome [Burkholderiaceae bacterium]|nr:c-type cytochrome [Burkholderiaceae bacterium]